MNDSNDLPIGMMDQPPSVIANFRRMVASGESPRLAEMLAIRKGPCLGTDTAHFAGMKNLDQILGPAQAAKIRSQARAAGIAITQDSFYNAAFADKRQGGDPGAWLLAGDGRDKLKKTCRDRGGASDELGIEFGESQQRVDKAQKEIEAYRAKKKQFKKMQGQLQADLASGHVPKSLKKLQDKQRKMQKA